MSAAVLKDVTVDRCGFYHPASEAQVGALIRRARREKRQVRIRGAAHSVPAAIYTDGLGKAETGKPGINIMLDRFAAVSFDEARKQVTVQTGCHLGKDPRDPTRSSTEANSLFYQLDRKGWAIPDMGGVTHQTVGGFMSTGSSGGSVTHALGEHIVAIRIIDGTGIAHDLTAAATPERFYAAGVSLGMLGVITAVTFQCVDRFNITGQEAITTYEDCAIDLFGSGKPGKPGLSEFLRSTPYARLMWWPQAGVERVAVWQARPMTAAATLHRQPYQEFPRILRSTLPAQATGSVIYTLVGRRPERSQGILQAVRYSTVVLPKILKWFVPLDGRKGSQHFQDSWWHGLPMDNQVDERLFPTEFTELWVPLARTQDVMHTLSQHYQARGMEATGAFACEIYAAKQSRFWMSPAFGTDAVRINLFWFGYNRGNPAEYYRQFWELLKPFGYRLHWGKHLPEDLQGHWAEYLSRQYPHWHDFLAVRAEMDPDQLFVTDYWRRHLAIPPVGAPTEGAMRL